MRYESFHDEFLDELYELITQSFESPSYFHDFFIFYKSENFYHEINNLLNYFENLLRKKKSFENKNDDYIKAIKDLFPYLKKLSKKLRTMKKLFSIQNETLFEGLDDDLCSLKSAIKKMKKNYNLYVDWITESRIIYSHENKDLENYRKRNNFIPFKTTLSSLGYKKSNDRKNLKKHISEFFIFYYKNVKNISKCLSKFADELDTFIIYCEKCDSDYNEMGKILENN
ncbi:hypothetical protein NBO_11g0021 [Nosema bombycis CQ1]|uniref:Uncharacterized protein n=1 Tax=Nosema bombycis (strain CQ1 / CVCC 102059) TaxID=578461 RepID=R0MQ14_NOSB1|nr:hypothetical protein NBO_11g0021 [Nosema bombycis CQ1]|eukprot:EOB14948.1 hypothetical protein NBO_11g0021 [Nosema bombycis CQ1]